MTNAVTAGRLAATAPTTPAQARSTWPRMALLGAVLLVLAVVAAVWDGVGPRLLLAGIGVLAAVRGTTMLRGARNGRFDRSGALVGAGLTWLSAVLVGVALLSGTATGWAFVVAGVLALPALAAVAAVRRAAAVAGAVVVAAAAVLLAALGGVDTLLDAGRLLGALVVGVLGVANLAGAGGLARIARRPEPAPSAGCGGCACGAGGCGSRG
ncbi:hypothetical protein [Modestobacter italicus]|uniref:hypothetical protein n=1 Tax=Modestobacter italicus (strain DSM 44449 / CECT 9708 / BC 501) TaxID=2732864 RepID=UPI001C9646AD|nr:hypothetical protein [Modestobacter italicus]